MNKVYAINNIRSELILYLMINVFKKIDEKVEVL